MQADLLEALEHEAQAVIKPLAAMPARKRAMCDELVAHMWCIYQEEMEEGRDGKVVLAVVHGRLGDAGALRRELQCAVPLWERLVFSGILSKENSMLRLVLLSGVAAVLFGMAMVMPAMAKLNLSGLTDVMIALIVGTFITTVGLALVVWGAWGRRPRVI